MEIGVGIGNTKHKKCKEQEFITYMRFPRNILEPSVQVKRSRSMELLGASTGADGSQTTSRTSKYVFGAENIFKSIAKLIKIDKESLQNKEIGLSMEAVADLMIDDILLWNAFLQELTSANVVTDLGTMEVFGKFVVENKEWIKTRYEVHEQKLAMENSKEQESEKTKIKQNSYWYLLQRLQKSSLNNSDGNEKSMIDLDNKNSD